MGVGSRCGCKWRNTQRQVRAKGDADRSYMRGRNPRVDSQSQLTGPTKKKPSQPVSVCTFVLLTGDNPKACGGGMGCNLGQNDVGQSGT